MRYINLQNPLQGRQWLKLLQPDPECGFLLKPCIDMDRRMMGFAFDSNSIGLRGPADHEATQVVLGTSFAMGIAVDREQDWHRVALARSGWLNLGLAVGIPEWAVLLRRFHGGRPDCAWLLYHPNFWAIAKMFEKWRHSDVDVFKAFRWKTALGPCAYLTIKRLLKSRFLRRSGKTLVVRDQDRTMNIETEYAHVDPAAELAFGESQITRLYELLERFRRIRVVRLRVKQELVPVECRNALLGRTCDGYNRWWDMCRAGLSRLGARCEFLEPDMFRLRDYHSHDTHWNEAGNASFARWLESKL